MKLRLFAWMLCGVVAFFAGGCGVGVGQDALNGTQLLAVDDLLTPDEDEVTTCNETIQFFPEDLEAKAGFGWAIAVDGDLVAIATKSYSQHKGLVYLYKRGAGPDDWTMIKKIIPSDGADYDYFGQSIALRDGILAVGAPQAPDDNINIDAGAVYLFYQNEGGQNNWGEKLKLRRPDGSTSTYFGVSVALDEGILVVGNQHDSVLGALSGSASVFYQNEGGADTWGFVKQLFASDGAANDYFGNKVSLNGGIVAVGAPFNDTPHTDGGSVYLYYKDEGGVDNWGEKKKLNGYDENDIFGSEITLQDDMLAVGILGIYETQGAVTLFSKDQGGADAWGEIVTVSAYNAPADESENFGKSIALKDKALLVGAPNNSEKVHSGGVAYLFEENMIQPGNWVLSQILLASDNAAGDEFGHAVALFDDGVALVGTKNHEEYRGVVYAYYPAEDIEVTDDDEIFSDEDAPLQTDEMTDDLIPDEATDTVVTDETTDTVAPDVDTAVTDNGETPDDEEEEEGHHDSDGCALVTI
jgi:hypothetical protein